MSDTNDSSVNLPDSERPLHDRSGSTNGVGLADADDSEDVDQFLDYIDFARSAGSTCRHLNRARRHRYLTSAPDRFDE